MLEFEVIYKDPTGHTIEVAIGCENCTSLLRSSVWDGYSDNYLTLETKIISYKEAHELITASKKRLSNE